MQPAAPYPPELFAEIRAAYEAMTIPRYYERKNTGTGRTMFLGIGCRRNYGIGPARMNDKGARILEAARALSSVICPDLPWTTLAVNVDYEAAKHTDAHNDGESVVVAFGDYSGGELQTWDASGNLLASYDLRHRPFRFRAAETIHSVAPITSGHRLSIVFFRPRFPRRFEERHGRLGYDALMRLIPERKEGQRLSELKIDY